MDDDDGEPVSRSHQRKVQSFSQPLGRDAAIAAAKRNAARKHSLDDASPVINAGDKSNLPFSAYPYHNRSSSDETLPFPPRHPTSSFSSGGGDGLTLDRAMGEFGGAPGTLPEFNGVGGGNGIFRVPVRAAVHPARPPAVEVRPHPLRETQFGAFLRTIACSADGHQIWAGQESGLRVWKAGDLFEVATGRMKRGDEESAPFRESAKMSPTLCLVVDGSTGVVWSGHKDGKIRSWKMEKAKVRTLLLDEEEEVVDADKRTNEGKEAPFKEGLTWQAHRTPVLSMIISSYGNFR